MAFGSERNRQSSSKAQQRSIPDLGNERETYPNYAFNSQNVSKFLLPGKICLLNVDELIFALARYKNPYLCSLSSVELA